MKKKFSAYMHIPFCKRKCPYCDFNIHVNALVPEEDYVHALLRELKQRAREDSWKGRVLQSIYFGGGTPSLFRGASIEVLISGLKNCFPLLDGSEITLEANPEDLELAALEGYRAAGITRLSLGAQSFSEKSLKKLGRRHTEKDIVKALTYARKAGFDNINLDLIFALPEESLDEWHADLKAGLSLSPEHFSLYGLGIEQGTPFFRDQQEGKLRLPLEDEAAAMMDLGYQELTKNGYVQYEISNYALPGKESVHNLAYWNGDDYLGLGAGAHSFIRAEFPKMGIFGLRWGNYTEPEYYIQTLAASKKAVSWEERLDQSAARFEFFFMGLRKLKGVSLAEYGRLFNRDFMADYGILLRKLTTAGLIELEDDMMRLSRKGILLADSVICEFA